jgi:hypothetical protein
VKPSDDERTDESREELWPGEQKYELMTWLIAYSFFLHLEHVPKICRVELCDLKFLFLHTSS